MSTQPVFSSVQADATRPGQWLRVPAREAVLVPYGVSKFAVLVPTLTALQFGAAVAHLSIHGRLANNDTRVNVDVDLDFDPSIGMYGMHACMRMSAANFS